MRAQIQAARTAMLEAGPLQATSLVGFDGFVDEILEVVDQRHSLDQYTPVTTIEQWGHRIVRAAGLSTNMELVRREVRMGGNGPLMANALAALGVGVTYVGSVGDGEVVPAFEAFGTRCRVFPIAPPAHTDAVEFQDGKVMLGKLEPLSAVTWERIASRVGAERFASLITGADLVAMVNWTMLPHMTEIWKAVTSRILPLSPARSPKPWAFFDLADPEKRGAAHIVEAIEEIRAFRSHFRVILGLNRKEAYEVAAALELAGTQPSAQAPLNELAPALAQALRLDTLVIHPPNSALAVQHGRITEIEGPYTSRPKLTTGAGDNFNAGFCSGLLAGLPIEHALVVGKAVSGYYVRHGQSPSRGELLAFMGLWASRHGQDF